MKVYISVDIEGVAGITHWDEAEIGKPGYEAFREQMTAEATAACEGALAAGASEVVVTPHVAGGSGFGSIRHVAENYRRALAGETLIHQADRALGY